MKKTTTRSLSLRAETIRSLRALADVHGACLGGGTIITLCNGTTSCPEDDTEMKEFPTYGVECLKPAPTK
jgi:hypothetical protein